MDLLAGCTSYAETILQCCLLPQTITATYDVRDVGCHPWEPLNVYELGAGKGFALPRGPVISITSIIDANSVAVPYWRHTTGNLDLIVPDYPIVPAQCPLTVVYQAGYATIPADILNAIRVHTATMYMLREDVSALPANAVHKIDDYYRAVGRASLVA
jgi:hypothetical protein